MTTSTLNRALVFTEHENHLTTGMPDLVAVGYVNARRRDGRGERAGELLVVQGVDVYIDNNGGDAAGFGDIASLFGGNLFGGK
ncbi:hypothetical protein [Arthrobacter sp. SLBN-53]|uniref:hypothetical protein n=1 Tax=Arthrobacter sp. SLBN-53 TaxID=2768412 RepID=UPI0011524725|nr:hypothetical protein [Arthrobacter sp. SLBN-53]TQK29411.1 hypothetical protein FBY28_2414 [Arthrobacter sp. SLBN-53]